MNSPTFALLASAILTSVGCESTPPATAAGVNSSDFAERADFAKFADNLRAELHRSLQSQYFVPYSDAEIDAEKRRFQFVFAAWKLNGKTVRMYSDPETQRLALFVEVLDEQQMPIKAEQEALEKAVGSIVAAERNKFERAHPDSTLNETRDLIPAVSGGK